MFGKKSIACPGMNKTYRRYLPDDSKCNFCFISKRRCDRDTVGTPCTHCERSRARCIDQTADSQSLIDPKHRNQRRQVQQTQRIEQAPPCARCYAKGRTCIRTGPKGTPCNLCRRDFTRCTAEHIARQCHFDLTGVTAPDKTNTRAGGEHAVPYDQKCYRCATLGRACNGKHPCNNCTTMRGGGEGIRQPTRLSCDWRVATKTFLKQPSALCSLQL